MSRPGGVFLMSIRKYDRPLCLATSESVRARQIPQSATLAIDVHTFWPCSFQPPSTLVALVDRPARSEPAPGSENSWHQTMSPRSDPGTNRSSCSSLPCAMSVGTTQFPMIMSCGSSSAARSSSAITSWVTGSALLPPQGAGRCGAV